MACGAISCLYFFYTMSGIDAMWRHYWNYLMLLCWILVNVTCIIVILALFEYIYIYLGHSTKFILKNLGTVKINCFRPKLLESYGVQLDKYKSSIEKSGHIRSIYLQLTKRYGFVTLWSAHIYPIQNLTSRKCTTYMRLLPLGRLCVVCNAMICLNVLKELK